MPRLGLGLGLAKGSVLPTIDAEALALYNRVIADGGIIPAGLDGCNNYIKSAKAARGISTLAQGYLSLAHPQYTGIRLATGTGPTAGNRAARTVYNALGSTGDFIQTTAANQPLALVHSGTNYVWLPGVSNNNFTTPNATANQITGDIDIKAKIDYSNNGTTQFVVSKTQTAVTNHGYDFGIDSSNLLYYQQTRTGSFNLASSSVGIGASYSGWVRMTRVSSTGVVTFYTSSDGTTWTQLGTTSTLYTGALDNPNAPVAIGSYFNNNNVFRGVINRVTISNSINGSAVVDFNPDSYSRATSQTTWTSATGEVWTLNTPNTNNALKAAIVDTTMIMGNGTSYGMQAASLNMNQAAITDFTAFAKYVNTAGSQVINELGANATAAAGKALYLNTQANQEDVWIYANVGGYNSRFTSTNLGLKLATAVNNINNANESSPYLINNSSQSYVASDVVNNNTANMNATGYNLLARNNASSLWANALMVADAVCIDELDNTQMTSMYNFFKTYINGI